MIDDNMRLAARELRERCGTPARPISQTEMAARIGKTLNTVQRYEESGKIPLEALVLYFNVSVEVGANDLAERFRSGIIGAIGSDVLSILEWDQAARTRKIRLSSREYLEVDPSVKDVLDECQHLVLHPMTRAEELESQYLIARLRERAAFRGKKRNGTNGGESR